LGSCRQETDFSENTYICEKVTIYVSNCGDSICQSDPKHGDTTRRVRRRGVGDTDRTFSGIYADVDITVDLKTVWACVVKGDGLRV